MCAQAVEELRELLYVQGEQLNTPTKMLSRPWGVVVAIATAVCLLGFALVLWFEFSAQNEANARWSMVQVGMEADQLKAHLGAPDWIWEPPFAGVDVPRRRVGPLPTSGEVWVYHHLSIRLFVCISVYGIVTEKFDVRG